MILGFTSGRFQNKDSFMGRINFFKSLGCNAIELHVKNYDHDFLSYIEFLAGAVKGFKYVSIHAPSSDFYYDTSKKSVKKIEQVSNLINVVGASLVVVHPDKIKIPQVLIDAKWPLGIENMDRNKDDGKTVDQIRKWLDIFPNASMVLDLNHVYTLDPTMNLAKDFYEGFADKISEIHLSGYIDEKNIHEPLVLSNCEIIMRTVHNWDLPVILEIDTTNLSQEVLRKEFEYVKEKLLAAKSKCWVSNQNTDL